MPKSIADREEKLKHFINSCFPREVHNTCIPLLGDAGLRNYYRAKSGDKSYIVMDYPDHPFLLQRFIDISKHINLIGLSSPQIIAKDIKNGFLLLEDFGSVSMKDYLLNCTSSKERDEAYYLAIDLLLWIQSQSVPTYLKNFDTALLLAELKIFIEWYVPYAYQQRIGKKQLEEFEAIWQDILSLQSPMPQCLVLKDYHVENIMHLGDRAGLMKLGLLDFQDALIGSPVYDLVSILEDARIDVSQENAIKYIEYFCRKNDMDMEQVMLEYHILGAQRNSRILGVFARKAMRDSDTNYLKYIPRVLKYLNNDLSHSALAPLKSWFDKLNRVK